MIQSNNRIAGNQITVPIIVPAASVIANTDSLSGDYPYCYDYSINGMSADFRAAINITSSSYYSIYKACCNGTNQTMEGKIRVYFRSIPSADLGITITYVLRSVVPSGKIVASDYTSDGEISKALPTIETGSITENGLTWNYSVIKTKKFRQYYFYTTISSLSVSVGWGSVFLSSALGGFTYPETFVSTPNVQCSYSSTGATAGVLFDSCTTSSFGTWYLVRGYSNTTSGTLCVAVSGIVS